LFVVFAQSLVEMCILSPVHFRPECIIKVFQINSSKSGSNHKENCERAGQKLLGKQISTSACVLVLW